MKVNLDPVFDKIVELQIRGLKPGSVIIGIAEFEALMGEVYNSFRVPNATGPFMLVGLPVVLDPFSDSRLDVSPEASFLTYRVAFRPGGKWPIKKEKTA